MPRGPLATAHDQCELTTAQERDLMSVKTLSDLIRDHQAATGDSYATIGLKSGISKPKIGQLAAAGNISMPRAKTLEKLAQGLQIPLHIVQSAALASAGIVAPEISQPATALLLTRYNELKPEFQGIVQDLVAALYQRQHGEKKED